jgi:flagellar biosynthesis/type III secretory pathway chaperone
MNNMMRNFTRPMPNTVSRPTAPQARPANAAAPGAATAQARPGKADDIFMVLRQLSELLVKENAALKRYKVEEVRALAERKDRLAILYQNHMNAIHRDPTLVASLDTAKRTQLMQLAARLADLMRDNASMLKANIQSIDTYFQAVNEAVRVREEKKSASYSRGGTMTSYLSTKRNLAVSFNQTT